MKKEYEKPQILVEDYNITDLLVHAIHGHQLKFLIKIPVLLLLHIILIQEIMHVLEDILIVWEFMTVYVIMVQKVITFSLHRI